MDNVLAAKLPDHDVGNCRRFLSDDREEIVEFATSLFCPHQFRLGDQTKTLRTDIRYGTLGSITLSSITYGGEVTVQPKTLDDFFLVQTVVAGQIDTHSGNQRSNASAGVTTIISPGQPTRMHWSDSAELLSIKFEKSVMEDHLSCLLGEQLDRPLVFDLHLDTNEERGKTWLGAIAAIQNQVMYSNWPSQDLQRWAMNTLLELQPNSYSAQLSASLGQSITSSVVRRALSFMRQNMRADLTNQIVADAVGISERALIVQFRKYFDRTPKQHMRHMRLHNTRQCLLNPRPSTTVTDAFVNSGVRHFGRFSGVYKTHFGEAPSATLARAKHLTECKRYQC